MSSSFAIGTPPIEITYTMNPRARRLSLRISNRTGAAKMTLPRGVALREAMAFAQSKENWLRKHMSHIQPARAPEFGDDMLLDGASYELVPGVKRGVILQGDKMHVKTAAQTLSPPLKAFYKSLARDRFWTASEHYAALINRKIKGISLRDTKSRWGSCSHDGRLMYSWRLVMAPRAVQDYVAAHEVCHLIEMNHSDRYWALVDSIYPDHKPQRAWLRKNGQSLHQYAL